MQNIQIRNKSTVLEYLYRLSRKVYCILLNVIMYQSVHVCICGFVEIVVSVYDVGTRAPVFQFQTAIKQILLAEVDVIVNVMKKQRYKSFYYYVFVNGAIFVNHVYFRV